MLHANLTILFYLLPLNDYLDRRQLSPAIANWINENFSIQAIAVRDLGLRDAEDEEIFLEAKNANAIVMTKDRDFLILLDKFGVPPQVIWLTCETHQMPGLKKFSK